MRQPRDGPRLAPEPVDRVGRRAVTREEHLDRELPSELDVLSGPHDAARPFADLLEEPVRRPREDARVVVHVLRGDLHHPARHRRVVLGAQAARDLEELRELAPRAGRLVRPERAHEGLDPPAHAPLAVRARRRHRQHAAEIDRREGAARVAVVRVVRDELLDDHVELLRRLDQVGQLGHLHVPGSGLFQVLLRVSREKPASGAQLPEHDPERVQIDPPVPHLLPRDFGRHVPRLREHHAGDRVALSVLPARGAEVDELHLADVADHHVLRRQIAVHDPERCPVAPCPLVHVPESVRHLDRHRHGLRPAEPRPELDGPPAHVREAPPFDVLDDRVRLAVLVGARLEHLRDAGVIELRLDARFVEEAREERAVVDVVAADGLHHAGALGPFDPGRRGEVDVAHPAAGEELEEEQSSEDARQRHRVARGEAARFGCRAGAHALTLRTAPDPANLTLGRSGPHPGPSPEAGIGSRRRLSDDGRGPRRAGSVGGADGERVAVRVAGRLLRLDGEARRGGRRC